MELKNSLNSVGPIAGNPAGPRAERTQSGDAFDSVLKGQLGSLQQKPSAPVANLIPQGTVKFSAHAVERMKSRGIAFSPETLRRLEDAVDRAAEKGSRESLVLTDNAALIVSIKNKTVITAMDREAMKENVFTNIDSTVLL